MTPVIHFPDKNPAIEEINTGFLKRASAQQRRTHMGKWIKIAEEIAKGALAVGVGVYVGSWLSKKFPIA